MSVRRDRATPPEPPRGSARAATLGTIAAYAAMLAAAVLAFLWIRSLGLGLVAPAPAAGDAPLFGTRAPGGSGHVFLHVLLALLLIIAAARLVGMVFRRIGQPPVIGEVVAGILIGPSLLGRVAPEAHAFLLPAEVTPLLGVIAQVGVILYMFLVGLELNPEPIRRSPETALAISHASIVVPFLLGSLLALALYPILATSDVPFTPFALFLGVSMSVTAFPVLARILTDRRLQRTPLGVLALTCAAVDDVTAWCLLAFVASVARADGASAFATVGLTAGFIAFVLLVLQPLLVRAVARIDRAPGSTSADAIAVTFILLLAAAFATEAIGIHALFGAFLIGVVIPHGSRLARDLRERLEDVVVVLLLPAFFAVSGLKTEIQLVRGAEEWLLCGLIVLVASAGKIGGSAVAARLAGLSWRRSTALGVLMNTRGLVELIVLNVGLDLGVISPTLFAMLVVMALVTTVATAPLLGWIGAEEAEKAAPEPRPAAR